METTNELISDLCFRKKKLLKQAVQTKTSCRRILIRAITINSWLNQRVRPVLGIFKVSFFWGQNIEEALHKSSSMTAWKWQGMAKHRCTTSSTRLSLFHKVRAASPKSQMDSDLSNASMCGSFDFFCVFLVLKNLPMIVSYSLKDQSSCYSTWFRNCSILVWYSLTSEWSWVICVSDAFT